MLTRSRPACTPPMCKRLTQHGGRRSPCGRCGHAGGHHSRRSVAPALHTCQLLTHFEHPGWWARVLLVPPLPASSAWRTCVTKPAILIKKGSHIPCYSSDPEATLMVCNLVRHTFGCSIFSGITAISARHAPRGRHCRFHQGASRRAPASLSCVALMCNGR